MTGNPMDVVRCPIHSANILLAAIQCHGKMAMFWRMHEGMSIPEEPVAEAA